MTDFQIRHFNTYPKISTPNYLRDASNIKVHFEEVYPHVKRPVFTKSTKQDENKDLKIFGGGIGCGFILYFAIWILCLIFTGIFFNIPSDTWKTSWYPVLQPIILAISIIGAIVIVILGFRENEREKNKSQENEKKQFEKYQAELEKYNKLVASVMSDEFQNQEKQKRIRKILSDNKKEVFRCLEIKRDGEIKKGISEEFFHKFLTSYSDFTVYKSIKYSYYYPDLILVKHDIVVDLEIDEPYTFETNEPIHYENSDNSRDEFFLNNDFVLIRFTEEQIIENPDKCLDIINEIIDACRGLKPYPKSKSYLEIESKIMTYQEAFDLAYNNSRKNVQDRISKLENEYFS